MYFCTMITVQNTPYKYHFLGNGPTVVLKCWHTASSGSYAKFQYVISSAIKEGAKIGVVANGRKIVFVKATGNGSFAFSSNINLVEKLQSCIYLREFNISYSQYNDSGDILVSIESKERNEYSFEMYECYEKVNDFVFERFQFDGKTVAVKKTGGCVGEISTFGGKKKSSLPNYAIVARWETEDKTTPEVFFYPDKNGIVKINSRVVGSLMGEYHCPDFNLSAVPKRIFVDEKYRLMIGEQYGEPALVQNTVFTEWFHGLDGELTEDFAVADMPDWVDKRDNDKINSTNNIVRIIGRDTDKTVYVQKSKPEYIYVLASNTAIGDNDVMTIDIKMVSVMKDGSTQKNLESYELKNHCVYVFNANADNESVAYRKISVSRGVECFSTTIVVEDDFYEQYYFLIKNRYGTASCFVADNIAIEKAVDVERYSIGKKIINDYFNLQELFRTRLLLKKDEARDFNTFDYKHAYMLVRGAWRKINITSTNIKIINSDNDICEVELDFCFKDNDINNYITLNQTGIVFDEDVINHETIVKL